MPAIADRDLQTPRNMTLGIQAATRSRHDGREQHRQETMDQLTGGSERHEPRPQRRQEPKKDHRSRSNPSSNSDSKRQSWMEKMKLSRSKEAPKPAESHAPADAPVSAVNSGDRSVRVRYKNSSITLAVTPVTHVEDILSSAANYFTDVDPSTFILMESFSSNQIGLQRPLRRYEYVRDIMNSWAYDGENALFIIPTSSAEGLRPLEAPNVPVERPTDTTFHLYHSQRPRKWDKRYVTLHSDGQVTVSKKLQAKNQTSICHISDFDIYTPTVHTVTDIRPPKMTCYAIKSQQKSNLFVSNDTFVHFFSTNDRRMADDWYQAVQTWRSWYLVHVLGAGDPQVDMNRRNEAMGRHHSNRNSIDRHVSDPDPQPLIDHTRSSPKDLFSRRKGAREHAPPPSAFPKKLTPDAEPTGPLLQKDESPFSPTGFLGRTYSMRQRDMREREEREKRMNEEPFTSQGLCLSNRIPSRSNVKSSSHDPSGPGLSRANSIRQKPLVDLTPVYQEPPQHRNKGKGITVEPGVPLVEAATSLELATNAIVPPPSTTWRRQPEESQTQPQSRFRYRSNTVRSANPQAQRRAPSTHHTAPSSPTRDYETSPEFPFAPNSLLARSTSTAARGNPVGHGVATGDRNATKPMLDLSEDNPFADGSLLRQLT